MSNQVDAEVKEIFDEALARYKQGAKTYGVFDKYTDPRNFLKEAEEELLDTIIYTTFEIAKIRTLNNKLNSLMEDLGKRLSGQNDHDHDHINTGQDGPDAKVIDEPHYEPFTISVEGDDYR